MRVQVINEVNDGEPGDWVLCFQWCNYIFDNGTIDKGYRFIWRRPDGSMQPARGQARIPSLAEAERLFCLAREAGWGDHNAQ